MAERGSWSMARKGAIGLLVAAAGIGGSDVSMAALTGSRFGLALLWAILAGAIVKFAVNEGITRWQIATGETLLEGVVTRWGAWARYGFLAYLLVWTFAVGASLMSACGVVADTILATAGMGEGWGGMGEQQRRVALGFTQSVGAAALVLSGGYVWFRRVMGVLTVAMVALVVGAAALTRPDLGALARGLFVPRVPLDDREGIQWTIGLAGAIGGTVTMLAHGYWMRAEARTAAGHGHKGEARLQLGIAYTITAVFGIALTVVSADVPVHATGSDLFHAVAGRLRTTVGTGAAWLYLGGAWCAVFACMLGVWQFIPMLFADCVAFGRADRAGPSEEEPRQVERRWAYRGYLAAMATIPAVGVWMHFADVQRAFAVLGAMFVPMVALALLILNNRRGLMGREANGALANLVLGVALVVSIGGLVIEALRAVSR